ncbi:MAG: tripartite tricarboxylate transporter substrate binding protein [Betaproteobacteria bacterium]
MQRTLAKARPVGRRLVMRLRLAQGAGVLAAGLAAPLPAAAEAPKSCPGGAVRIIVPVAAGGPMDHLARSLAQRLSSTRGLAHVVDNRSGGMTIPAWDAVAKAAPDGCTLLIASTSGRTVLPFQARPPYDPAKDLLPVTPLADVPQLFVAHQSSGLQSLGDLVQRARQDPRGVTMAIPSPGALTHLAAVALQRAAGIRLVEVPYRGGAPAALAVRSGEVAAMSADVGAVLPMVQAGELVPLATASAKRLPQLPQVPTVAEAGFGDMEAVNVYALFAPAGLPPAMLRSLHAEVEAALRQPEIARPLLAIGMAPRTASPAAFAAELTEQVRRLEPLARQAAQLAP